MINKLNHVANKFNFFKKLLSSNIGHDLEKKLNKELLKRLQLRYDFYDTFYKKRK